MLTARSSNTRRRGHINLGVYLLVALMAVTIGIAGFMPYSALLMVVPGFLIALIVAIAWVWATAYARTVRA